LVPEPSKNKEHKLKNTIPAGYTPQETLSRGTNTTTISQEKNRNENTWTADLEGLK